MQKKSNPKKSSSVSQDILFKIRKEKIHIEIESAKKIINSGVEPLTIADNFLHSVFLLLKNGILERDPNIDIEAVNKMIRKNMLLTMHIKSLQKK